MELNELHKKLNRHLLAQNFGWDSLIYAKQEGFYQGFEKIKIKGCRPTEERFQRYNIFKYFNKNHSALDIGSNCGFCTLYMSEFIRDIDGVEINPYLNNIANDTRDYLSINNAFFHTSTFENYNSKKKYDIIFSFANDSTIDGNTTFNFYEYIGKILSLLNSGGLLIFESQAIDATNEDLFNPKLNHLSQNFEVIEYRSVPSNYPYNVKERKFLVLKRKSSN